MGHIHSSYESTNHFRINPFTRSIINESEVDIIITQHDHNSERFIFELPKIIEEHDMMLCSSVRIHFINAGANDTIKSIYEVEDLKVSETNADVVTFSWPISSSITSLDGVLSFAIQFVCLTGNTIDYSWSTLPYKSIKIHDTYNNAENIIEEDYTDILEQWKEELFASFNKSIDDFCSKDETDEKIEAKLAEYYDITEVDNRTTMKPISLVGITSSPQLADNDYGQYTILDNTIENDDRDRVYTIDFQGYVNLKIVPNDNTTRSILYVDGVDIDKIPGDDNALVYLGLVSENISLRLRSNVVATFETFYGMPILTDSQVEKIDKCYQAHTTNALKSSASGEVIRVDDVSPVEHKAILKASSKNVLDISALLGTNLQPNNDGTYTFYKTTVGVSETTNPMIVDLPAGTYTFSMNVIDSSAGGMRIIPGFEDGTVGLYTVLTNKGTVTFESTKRIKSFKFGFASSVTDGDYIKFSNPQINYGDAALEYTSYVDPTEVSLRRFGKNLLEIRTDYSETISGVTFTIDDTGKCVVNGTNTTSDWIFAYVKISDSLFFIPKGTMVTVSGINSPDSTCAIRIFTDKAVGNTIGGLQGDYYDPKTITLEDNTTIKTVLIRVGPNATINNVVVTPQIELGSNATSYEQFKSAKFYTPASDGTFEIDAIAPTMTVLTNKSGVNIDLEYQQDHNKAMNDVRSDIKTLDNSVATLATAVGDFDAALDAAIALCDSYIGGESS